MKIDVFKAMKYKKDAYIAVFAFWLWRYLQNTLKNLPKSSLTYCFSKEYIFEKRIQLIGYKLIKCLGGFPFKFHKNKD